jgi:uncharacterized DUF497 family protein
MGLRFLWDPRKASANVRKHGVSFDEASTAFADPLSITIPDPEHSAREERFILVGCSVRQRIIVVVHAERSKSDIRLISARIAGRLERRIYEEDDE